MTPSHAFKVVIPARYESSRLPGKPLAEIQGKPMIQWVVNAAELSRAADVWVATDDDRIAAAVEAFGGQVVLTAANHTSGTDRLAEVASTLDWPADTLVVNVQGDEPGMPPALIDQVADLLFAHADAGVASLYTPVFDPSVRQDTNAVKVLVSQTGKALYFSRAPVPHDRDGEPLAAGEPLARRHIGLYAYRVSALQAFTAWPPAPLEQREKLEQLRFMEHGIAIAMAEACVAPPVGVDTAEDLTRVRHVMQEAGR